MPPSLVGRLFVACSGSNLWLVDGPRLKTGPSWDLQKVSSCGYGGRGRKSIEQKQQPPQPPQPSQQQQQQQQQQATSNKQQATTTRKTSKVDNFQQHFQPPVFLKYNWLLVHWSTRIHQLGRRALLSTAPELCVFHTLFVAGWTIEHGQQTQTPSCQLSQLRWKNVLLQLKDSPWPACEKRESMPLPLNVRFVTWKVPYYERIAKERKGKESILAKSEPSAILDSGSFF